MSERWIPLDAKDCDPSPFVQFHAWFHDASEVMRDREAIALVTASSDAKPSARMVLLRHVDASSFGWYSNYESRKGVELDQNPYAALLWYCEGLGRQIRIEGSVEHMSAEESDEYFSARPRGHQLGAHASHQSAFLESRQYLETAMHDEELRYEGRDVPRPPYWGGFLLKPNFFEVWQHREDRLHDRVFYRLVGSTWVRERHAP